MRLQDFKARIEVGIAHAVEKMGEKNRLRDACEYALTNGGKRLRPLIVLMVAEALGQSLEVLPAALSVEFFHTASLIADDLPCMDNDDMRRGRFSLHKAFSEDVAILASYTLIAAGYGGIAENGRKMEAHPEFASQAGKVVTFCLNAATQYAGMRATHGQFLDLYPTDESLATFKKIVEMKTSALFEVSFLFGWLFGGGSLDAVEEIKRCGAHLGMAFQVADDLDDEDQKGMRFCGREEALALFEQEIFSFRKALKNLGLWTPSFQELFFLLDSGKRLPALFFDRAFA